MSSSHNHRRILSKSMNKIGRLAEQELEAAKSLKTAEDTELDGTPFIDRLQLIRASADAIVYKCLVTKVSTYQDVQRQGESVLAKYFALMATGQGQVFAKALADYTKAKHATRQKRMQLEHSRNEREDEHDINLRDVYADEGPFDDFWDELGSACEQLFNVAPPPETKHFAEIYEKMLQHEHHRDKHGNVRTVYAGHGFYLDIIAAHRSLSLYHHHAESEDSKLQLFALSTAGHELAIRCEEIKQIVAAQPRETIEGVSHPAYDVVGDYVLEPKNELPRTANSIAIRQVAMAFGTLLGLSDAANIHHIIRQRPGSQFVAGSRNLA